MACRPWLEEEIAAIAPDMLVCLGATAAQVLFGRSFALTKRRGQPFASEWAPWTMATFHPSALLRASDFAGGDALRATFEADLQLAARKLKCLG
jgi:Uracil-DNA glycosylase